MLANFFDRITRASVRRRWITIFLTFAVLAAGGYAYTQLNQELTPPVEFPQTIVVVQWPDAETTDDFLREVTQPLELALQGVEGVVNVESNTTNSLAFLTARNEFGEDQEQIRQDVEAAVAAVSLPEDVEPEVVKFSLSDLPVVVASVSSAELTLPELKTLIEDELEPELAEIDLVAQVAVGGGQELPEVVEVEETEEAETDADEAIVEETVEEEVVEEDPARLSALMIAGLEQYGFAGIEYAYDIPPEGGRGLIYEGGLLAQQALNLLTPDNLRAGLPETLAYLPSNYTDTLDPDLVAELNEISAEFGGVGQFTLEEAITARDAGLDVLTGLPIEEGTIDIVAAESEAEPADEIVADEPETITEEAMGMVEPVELPAEWIAAVAQQGLEIETTADLTPELVEGIAGFAPQFLDLLTDDMLMAMSPDVLLALPEEYLTTLDPELQVALTDLMLGDEGEMVAEEIEPVALPDEWIAAVAQQGLEIETTADLTPELIAGIAGVAPQFLDLLTDDMLLAMPLDAIGALPQEYLAGLDAELQAQLLERVSETASNGVPTAVDLPEAWVETATKAGFTMATTEDLTAGFIMAVSLFAPDQLADLTPEMLLAMPIEALPGFPQTFFAQLPPQLQAALAQRAAEATTPVAADSDIEPIALPDEWVEAAAAQGLEIETTADLTPELVQGIAQFAPESLEQLTPEILLAMPTASLAVLPEPFLAEQDADVQSAIADRLEAVADAAPTEEAATNDGEAIAAPEVPEVDPAALNPIFATVGEQVGVELATVDDIEPDFARQLGAFGEQGLQLLGLLTPENLRLLDPEVVALLPAEFLDSLEDEELRVFLDGRAVAYGGAGQLLITEAEAAAELAAASPPMNGIWLEPDVEGNPSQFQTAADLINNPFAPGAAALLNFFPNSPNIDDPRDWMGALNVEITTFLADNEADFAANLDRTILELFPPESITYLLDTFPEARSADDIDYLRDVAAGDVEVFVPEASITRADGDPSLTISINKVGEANTVNTFHEIDEVMAAFSAENDLNYVYAFEQASFIEESIEGVTREGALGALFAVIVILVFLSGSINGRYRLSWRATLITGLSIPASILFAFLLMWALPNTIGPAITTAARNTDNILLVSLARLFPASITLNIMTLSGLTVAIGRVVDDSIVVLENSYRYIQKGDDPFEAVFKGTREVAVAIFAATVTTMAVFLPLGFVGGLISEFFMPFGLTVTYALVASYIVSITVVPALTALLIRSENIPEEKETGMQRAYTPILEWALKNRGLTMGIASLIFAGSLFLVSQLPNSFIPSLGEPTINVALELPSGTGIIDTNNQVLELEEKVDALEGIDLILTDVGSTGGQEALFTGGSVQQNAASLTISVDEDADINVLSNEVRELAEAQFGEEAVSVNAASQAGFGGFALIVTGDDLNEIVEAAPDVIAALEVLDADEDGVLDMVNITSNAEAALDGSTIIRIDGRPAISFGAEIQTADTLGVTDAAIQAIDRVLPSGLQVTEGFDSAQQTEGFTAMISAIGVSIVLVYLIMALTFRSLIHPFTILFSLPFALVGASIALFITNSVLGISAMMGLLMLVGVVVTNGIVLLELVQQLKDGGEPTYEALVEGGRTRLRPIWMTALTAILALIPLAASSEGGAIIAAELGTAVIGGLIVSTALTLVVIPVVYSLFDQFTTWNQRRQYNRLSRRFASGD